MKTNGRLLLILLVSACLMSAGSTAAFAALSLSPSPSAATANSVWNMMTVWSDSDGVWPTLESSSRTEGLLNVGTSLGTVRQFIPDQWGEGLTWWPWVPSPDGFVGFSEPQEVLPDEQYREIGFISVQPDPEPMPLNASNVKNPAFHHGVDYVSEEVVSDAKDAVPAPGGDGSLQACVIQQTEEEDDVKAHPAVIVTSKVPVALVGVWTSAGQQLKARIRNAKEILTTWPAYSVIEIMEEGGKLPEGVNEVIVSYYAPGTKYVITEGSPLPMPYTVYRVSVRDSGRPYLLINPGILKLDPDRNPANLNKTDLKAEESPVLGIYRSMQDVKSGHSFFNVEDDRIDPAHPTDPPLPRYEPSSPNNPFGRLYFTNIPDEEDLREGTDYYVVVSTNAVSGVYTTSAKTGTNHYLGANGKPIGYCFKSGVIRLATPLEEPAVDPEAKTKIAGQRVYIDYRKLSQRTFTVAGTTSVGLVSGVTATPVGGFTFESKDAQCGLADGKFTIDTKTLPYGTYGARVEYWANYEGGPVVWFGGSIPMKHHELGPTTGARFRVAVSAGLNMSNPKQQPYNETALNKRNINNKLIYDPRQHPMYYYGLKAGPTGAPYAHILTAIGRGVKNRELVVQDVKAASGVSVTVHDSDRGGAIDHGGVVGNRDWLTIISDAARPSYTDVDPLSIEPVELANPARPDDGSSSNQFVFRVNYHNRDNLEPKPWLRPAADLWNRWRVGSGVVLYLDKVGIGDYRPHFMQPENPESRLGIYMYRIIPHNRMGWVGGVPDDNSWWPFQSDYFGYNPDGTTEDTTLYQSLSCGVYRYFFACSDDSLTFEDGVSFPFEYQSSAKMNPDDPLSKSGRQEWGETGGFYSSTGLDPSVQRTVTGYPEVDREKYRRYSSSGANVYDSTIYVDRPVRAPGKFESGRDEPYQYPCDVHPRISCELSMPSEDELGIRYDDKIYGWGRFFGTLYPYRFAVNPLLPGAKGSAGDDGLRAETSGSYSKDMNVFRILYKQLDNKAPLSIKLHINNASEKTGTTPEHVYKEYTMSPRAGQTVKDYRKGVWYEVKLQSGVQLIAGPHTYYFSANDGEQPVRWPVRPDNYSYKYFSAIHEWWVPSKSLAADYGKPDYWDNDFAPGPYVNSAPKITNVSVTPASGKEGDTFVYRATYSDADGQRPYSTKLTIEVNAAGDRRTVDMIIDPKHNLNPLTDNSEQYKEGVDLYFSSASMSDLAMEKGTRRFFVEFTDDWGRQTDVNDLRKGETTRYPVGDGNWVSGPTISGNSAPTLSKGSVTSADGTANAATLWTFKVNYRDKDNDPPAGIKLFIGRLQQGDKTVAEDSSKVKTVIWDAGNSMIKSEPSDNVYSDGAEYHFQTRLGAPDAAVLERTNVTMNDTLTVTPVGVPTKDIAAVVGVYMEGDPEDRNFYAGTLQPFATGDATIKLGTNLPNPPTGQLYVSYIPMASAVQYYYAFTAYDGVKYATYASSSNDDKRSDAAGCFVMQDAIRVDETHYVVVPEIAKQLTLSAASNRIDPDPERIGDIVKILGVYPNENLTGTNYLAAPVDYRGKTDTIQLSGLLPAGKIWLKCETETPILGPLPMQYPAPIGVIPDAEVFQNYSSNPDPLLLNGQKNGFVSNIPNDDGSFDRAVLMMNGTALFEGRPSGLYVTPESPADIASVEGVYWLDNPDVDHKYDNYFDPSLLDPPVVREGGVILGPTADHADKVVLVDPDEVYRVLGVYDNPDLEGHNYFAGAGYSESAARDQYEWQEAFVLDEAHVWPSNPMEIVSIRGIYKSMNASPSGNLMPPDADGYPMPYITSGLPGVDGEPVELPEALTDDPLPSRLYIAYYPPGVANELGQIVLTKKLPEDVNTVYVKIWAKGFNPGDSHIKLTEKLPDIYTPATVVTRGQVRPSDQSKIAEIGQVTGVFVEGDPINYYTGTLNPHTIGDLDIYLGSSLPSPLAGAVTIAYQPMERKVTVKYSDIRYTTVSSGTARQPIMTDYDPDTGEINPSMSNGNSFFVSDGRYVDYINILGNTIDEITDLPRDIDGGVVGVWANPDFSGRNYFDPRRVNRYDDDPKQLRLSTRPPVGTGVLYARAYQKGAYFIDRWNRTLRFNENSPVAELDKIQVSYFFGTKMPKRLLPNSLPTLSEGQVTPLTGAKGTQYIYSVKYTDVDGPNGQVPAYVRVVIDGVAHDMQPVSTGTPLYNAGAVFTYKPSGLSGGSHTYHFVASDGAAVAWFDKFGSHQAERGLPAVGIVDLDGPWVNDPPQLSNGAASPNPATGGISTKDSVDYTVTLRDSDNDAPYFYNPLTDPITGEVISGAPRLWVDAAVNDDTAIPVTGSIVALESDPLEVSKKRVMVIKITDSEGNLVDPNWTTDQFAGKLMQVTNSDKWSDVSSPPYLRVYLIQSNTFNKLTLAVDTLENDQLIVPKDPITGAARLVKFRINGLLMSKVDESQQNYATGVDYKITVPKLVVGSHKFHFTARTRETKPQWLLAMDEYTNKEPYSVMVRFPSVGDSPGPTVVSVTPPGNQKPVLSKIGASTIYRGPRPQPAAVIAPNRVIPSNYTALQSVSGVYVNANADAHLPAENQRDYFDSTSTPNPPLTGDPVKLSRNLPKLPDTGEIIMRGSVADSLRKVTPETPSAIGTVTAVYLGKDPRLSGAAYAVASATLGADNKITLVDSLPVGTADVFIKYKPATATRATVANGTDDVPIPDPGSMAYVVGVFTVADTNMTSNLADVSGWAPGVASVPLWGAPIAQGTNLVVKYVPWPPVYVQYFAPEPNTARPPIHGVFVAGEPLTFKVSYKDADGDPPTYHDGVQGYVQVVFSDTGRTSQLVPIGLGTSYTTGIPFGVTLTDVPEGTHPYHFEASDGYEVTKYYGSGTVASPEKVQVNYKPTLTNGNVDHTSGAAAFTFGVTYTDRDGVPPGPGGYVKVILKHRTDPNVMITVSMTTRVAVPNYATGVLYTGTVDATATGDGGVPVMPSGTYDTTFIANDGIQDADPVAGPTVTRRDTNTPPVLLDYEVRRLLPNGQLGPATGKTSDTFLYRAWYMDEDNDEPVFISGTGARQVALTLVIDEGKPNQLIVPMTTGVTNPDYTLPEGIEFQAKVTGKKLGPGNHTYKVRATDGTSEAVLAGGVLTIKPGPILMLPYFDLAIVGRNGEPITDRAIVGQEILINGTMYFPYTDANEQPGDIDNITIQVTKPDGTAVSLNASLQNIRTDSSTNPQNWLGDIVVKYSGYVDPALVTGKSLTLTASGQWILNATWPGDSLFDGVETDADFDGHNDQVRITVSGPSRTVAVADPVKPETSAPVTDMITPPMMIGSTNPGAIFGWDRASAMQIVRWVPTASQYYYYDMGGVFPPMQSGDAVWIKPKLGNSSQPGSGYPAAESLGTVYTMTATPSSLNVVPISVYASHILGVYTNAAKTGANYYVHGVAAVPFVAGAGQIALTSSLPVGTGTVWVSYVGSQSSVDEGWITLDNPFVQRVLVGGDPRYMHSQYRLIKVAAQSYPLKTGLSGSPELDVDTKLPKLKSSSIALRAGWNQIGNIFFNWKRASQPGTPAPGGPPPAPVAPGRVATKDIDQYKVVPIQASVIGRVLGVYLDQAMMGENYYQPGLSTQPYRRGDSSIQLTKPLPSSATKVYIKYEAYPREDVGIPWKDMRVTYLGVTKSIAEAKAAGWIMDYAWRYDPVTRQYVKVADIGGERVLKAWSGYWVRAYVECTLEIDPNTTFNGVFSGQAKSSAVGAMSPGEVVEMPPPAPD